MKKDDLNNEEFYNSLKKNIEKKINDKVIFDIIFKDLIFKVSNDNNLFIFCKSEEIVIYIRSNYLDIIKSVVMDVNKNIKNVFVENVDSNNQINSKGLFNTNKGNSKSLNPKMHFENYISGDFNIDLVKVSKKILLTDFILYSPCFIYGRSGLGKTHFLNAIGNEFDKKGKTVFLVSASNFTTEFLKKLSLNNAQETNNFIDSFKKADVILFDDIQQYSSKTATLNALFSIINYFIENEKQIFICSDREPELLGGFEERFITRFQAGLTLEIKPLSKKDLEKIVVFKLKQKGFKVNNFDKESITFIARNYGSTIRNIEGAINKLFFESNDNLSTEYFTEEKLRDIFNFLPLNDKFLTPEKIIKISSKYYEIPHNILKTKLRSAKVVLARDIAAWLLRTLLNLKFSEIGEELGGRDHSTILASFNRLEKRMDSDPSINLAIKKIKNDLKKPT